MCTPAGHWLDKLDTRQWGVKYFVFFLLRCQELHRVSYVQDKHSTTKRHPWPLTFLQPTSKMKTSVKALYIKWLFDHFLLGWFWVTSGSTQALLLAVPEDHMRNCGPRAGCEQTKCLHPCDSSLAQRCPKSQQNFFLLSHTQRLQATSHVGPGVLNRTIFIYSGTLSGNPQWGTQCVKPTVWLSLTHSSSLQRTNSISTPPFAHSTIWYASTLDVFRAEQALFPHFLNHIKVITMVMCAAGLI